MKKRQNAVHPPKFGINVKDYIFWCFMVVCCAILALCLFGCYPMIHINKKLGLPNDHLGEQILEGVADKMIEDYTGFDPDIELTPEHAE